MNQIMSLPCSKPSSSFLSIILGIKPKLLAMANNSLNGLVPSSFSSPICLKDPTGYHIVSQISQLLLPAHAVCSAWNAPPLNLVEIHFLNLSRPTVKQPFPGHPIKIVAPTIFYIFTLLSFSS